MTNHHEQLQESIKDADIPRLYFNGFTVSVGAPDAIIVLTQNEKPVLILNASHIIAKTLAEKLGGVISGFEDKVEQRVLTTDLINEIVGFDGENEEAEDDS